MTEKTLWLSFPEDSVSRRDFGPAARARFEGIFSLADSDAPWRGAMSLLGLKPPAGETQMIAWHRDAPYLNGSALAVIVSGGTATAVPDAARGFRFVTPHKILSLPRVMALQWRVTRFVQERLSGRAAPDARVLVESLALGLAVQVLLMRLDASVAGKMPQYLADPAAAPAMHRQTFRWLQALQMQRTALSGAWHEMFGDAPVREDAAPLPPFFWSGGEADIEEAGQEAVRACHAEISGAVSSGPEEADRQGADISVSDAAAFRGVPVSGAAVQGPCVPVLRVVDAPPPRADRPVYVFRQARPETTAYFAQAGAVVFAHGGVLSHACVVAREMGIPCVTGLGEAFYALVTAPGASMHLAVDGADGEVRVISC